MANARYILTKRAASEKYSADLRKVNYTFSEQFTHTPKYAFPDGSDGGFWVRCSNGRITVSSPTNRISICGDLALAISAPSTTDAGALSPPMASSAILITPDRVYLLPTCSQLTWGAGVLTQQAQQMEDPTISRQLRMFPVLRAHAATR